VQVAYPNLPFGGSAKSIPSNGLQLTRVDQDKAGGMNLFASTPYADFKFNGT